jgi:CBS domain containing-hemolysin-like protein
MIPLWEPLSVVTCLILSAFFSASETALTSISPTKALQLIESGRPGSQLLKHWLHSPAKLLTTMLIGNNLANILATAITTVIAESLFKNSSIAVTVGTMTFLIITFGEIFPKTIARHHAVKLSMILLRFLIFFYYILYPVTLFFAFLSEKIFRIPSAQYARRAPLVTLKDLDFFIALAQKEGSLVGPKGTYLKAVSEFSELRVKNIMIPQNKVTIMNSDIKIPELADILRKDMYTRYPVVNDNGTYIGILHAKDFLLNMEKCEQENSILEILRPAYWTNEFMKVDYVLELMKVKHTQMFLVKDEYNQFSGIITMEDILEELVGEIQDEHDPEGETNEEEDNKVFIVDGEDSVHDLNNRYELEIPEDQDFQTFNGFILHILNGVLPKKDALVTWGNLRVRILKSKNKNVEKAEITIL